MPRMFTDSRASIRVRGTAVPGADDRQGRISGFDQKALSSASILCIGAGGLISHVAPTLTRKGIGSLTLIDPDIVEASNLNRQRFYPEDIGENKAIALAWNLRRECIVETELTGIPMYFEEAVESGLELSCDIAICGVDNNPARVKVSRFFRRAMTPVIFTGVSVDGDHGYVFVQEPSGPCLGCLFPDMVNDRHFPCLRTPAVADILQGIGGFAVYAADTLLMNRLRIWNHRRVSLSGLTFDGATKVAQRKHGSLCCSVQWQP